MFSRKYSTELTSLSTLSVFEVEIWCYRGGDTVPKWIERKSGTQLFFSSSYTLTLILSFLGVDTFSTLCLVRADLSPLNDTAKPKEGKSGKRYWTIVFSIEIHFGLTEFRARIKWVDKDVSVCFFPIMKNRFAEQSLITDEDSIVSLLRDYP